MSEKIITLQPVSMVVPTAECIYAPSRLLPVKEISETEFKRFRPHIIKVSFADDGMSNPQTIVAYSGQGHWYLTVQSV